MRPALQRQIGMHAIYHADEGNEKYFIKKKMKSKLVNCAIRIGD
jgi:hypothetical protein